MHEQPKCQYLHFSLALEFNFRVLFPCKYLHERKKTFHDINQSYVETGSRILIIF